tara:strand:+ start:2263 stop:3543 length:1281 start_codon:yes stop_codon:yes gene_type:complete
MQFFETTKLFSLNRREYINLRWIAIIGQLITINLVKFYFEFEFNYTLTTIIIIFGILSNLFLIFFYNKNQITDRSSFIFLLTDITQLSTLIYLTGGIINPFSIFIIVPSIFSSIYLGKKTSILIAFITICTIIFLTFFQKPLPHPINNHFHVSDYYYYAVPLSLIIALGFLSYFSITFGIESRIRKEALNKMESLMAKEHELVSLGGQAAAAAHSLGTPLSTIKIILQDLIGELKDKEDITKDLNLLSSQVDRCIEILNKLSLNPSIDDKFLDKNLTLKIYLVQIIKSFEEISKKEFKLIFDQFNNPIVIPNLIEIVYGLRNFIGNANKFSKSKIFINLKSDSEKTYVKIEDDGPGFKKEILSKIGEPYINNFSNIKNKNQGLGLGIFIGKTLLEKNLANVTFSNSTTRSGAEINIIWKNKDLSSL